MKLLISSLLLSISAHALPDQEISRACLETGARKIAAQAKALGCTLSAPATARFVDNREENPSKYVWYSAPTYGACSREEIQVLVQYHNGECL